MKVLVIFESIEGQTRKIAAHVEKQIRAAGHDVLTFNAADKLGTVSFKGVDKIILAASVHERRHPAAFELFVTASRDDLQAHPSLMISVSLKAAFPEGLDEAQDYLTEMEMRTEFKPTKELLVAGAVRTSSYGYFESQIVKNVALDGRKIDLIDGVKEFTDWAGLTANVDAFLNS